MKKIIIFIIIIIQFPNLFSQSERTNHLKYWYYRNRFKYYFVKIGDCQGCSIPANRREGGFIHWGQSSIYLGEYIGVLATEYLLLKNHGDNESAEATRTELNFALRAAIRKDIATDEWASFYHCFPMNNGFDGFFLRDDVPESINYDFKDFNYNLDLSSTIYDVVNSNNKGMPLFGYTVESGYADHFFQLNSTSNLESQDEAIGLLMGMALVVRCLPPSTSEYSLAQQIAYKMVKYMADNGNYNTMLPCPINGNWRPQPGHNSTVYEYGLAASSNIIYPSGNLSQDNYFLWNTVAQVVGTTSDNNRMASTLAAISDSWTIKYYGIPIPSTGLSIKNQTWDYFGGFYIYLWKFLHNKSKDMTHFHGVDVTQNILDALNTAPCGGPYYYHYPPNIPVTGVPGWSSTDRLWTPQSHDGNDGFKGTFSGLDYMLMYNLYSLVNQLPTYYNMNDRKFNNAYYPYLQQHTNTYIEPLFWITIGGVSYPIGEHLVVEHYSTVEADEDNPYNYAAFNTIETNAVIDTKVHTSLISPSTTGTDKNGYVTMIAGKSIHLKPGFHAKKGSYFHASVHKIDICNGFNYKNNQDTSSISIFSPIDYNDIDPMPGSKLIHAQIDSLNKSFSQDDFSNTKEVFNIYPNPGNGLFYIQSNVINNNCNVIIVNEIGTVISQQYVSSLPFIINISNQPSGVYFITITTETDTYKLKYIKK